MKIVKTNSRTGFGLLLDNGNILPIESSFYEKKTDKTWLRLPENSTNRKLVDAALCQNGEYDLNTKVVRSNSTQNLNKNWLNYMSEEDKKLYEEIKNRSINNMKNIEINKINEEIERLMKLKESL